MPVDRNTIIEAFAADGFTPIAETTYNDRLGILAEHTRAVNAVTGRPKRALYVEGSGYEMGYLIGRLSESEVARMTSKFLDDILLEFIAPGSPIFVRFFVRNFLMVLIKKWCNSIYSRHRKDIPEQFWEELRGIHDGCKAVKPDSPVTMHDLISLNFGIDCLVSVIYTGFDVKDLERRFPEAVALFDTMREPLESLQPEHFRIPLACNAFAAFGAATSDDRCYFGRDFQFPTAGVYQDTACLIIHNPDYTIDGQRALPLVSQTAPGFVGSMTAMNLNGVAIGVNMSPAGNCDPLRPGLNSLPMVRYAAHGGAGAEQVVSLMEAAQRGASWIYPVADGSTNRAVVVEAGMTVDGDPDYLAYPPEELRHLLPAGPFDRSRRGLFARWSDWRYPQHYLKYNPGLFNALKTPYIEEQFSEQGRLNANWKVGVNHGWFFAPQREARPDLMVATNHFLVPEMRLCAMHEWSNRVARDSIPDIIWRYDELNRQCLAAAGRINDDKTGPGGTSVARELIDFLAPERKFPDYSGSENPPKVIRGSVTLCNLTDRIMASHFGYYADDWVEITLPRYIKG